MQYHNDFHKHTIFKHNFIIYVRNIILARVTRILITHNRHKLQNLASGKDEKLLSLLKADR